jgi:hypothetical protein
MQCKQFWGKFARFHLLQATCILTTTPECQSSDMEFISDYFICLVKILGPKREVTGRQQNCEASQLVLLTCYLDDHIKEGERV